MFSPFGQKFSKTETPLWHSHTACTFSPSPSLNPGLRLANSISGNVISSSLDSVSINPLKIIIIIFSLFKYEIKVFNSICHFVTELLNSSSQVFYQHEWLKFCQSPWRYLTCMRSGLDHLKDCYLPQQMFFSLTLGINLCYNMVQDLRIKISSTTFNYT